MDEYPIEHFVWFPSHYTHIMNASITRMRVLSSYIMANIAITAHVRRIQTIHSTIMSDSQKMTCKWHQKLLKVELHIKQGDGTASLGCYCQVNNSYRDATTGWRHSNRILATNYATQKEASNKNVEKSTNT